MLKFILVIHGLILIFADGSGKAGLTFEATNNALALQRINATNTHAGGWEKSALRGLLNTGDLWSLLPCELFQCFVEQLSLDSLRASEQLRVLPLCPQQRQL